MLRFSWFRASVSYTYRILAIEGCRLLCLLCMCALTLLGYLSQMWVLNAANVRLKSWGAPPSQQSINRWENAAPVYTKAMTD
jgi:sugar phosphate permease